MVQQEPTYHPYDTVVVDLQSTALSLTKPEAYEYLYAPAQPADNKILTFVAEVVCDRETKSNRSWTVITWI